MSSATAIAGWVSLSWIADFSAQAAQGSVLLQMPAHQVLQRRRGEEILLPQPQLLARHRGVARIEDARDRLGASPVGERADIVAEVEGLELQRVGGARRPQPKRVDVAAAPPDHRRVVGGGEHRLRGLPDALDDAALGDMLDRAAEADRVDHLGALELPRVAAGEPILRQLVLPAVDDGLAKQAVIVADAVAVSRHLEARQALHEAGGKPPEAAVPERRVRFGLADARRGRRQARRAPRAPCRGGRDCRAPRTAAAR